MYWGRELRIPRKKRRDVLQRRTNNSGLQVSYTIKASNKAHILLNRRDTHEGGLKGFHGLHEEDC